MALGYVLEKVYGALNPRPQALNSCNEGPQGVVLSTRASALEGRAEDVPRGHLLEYPGFGGVSVIEKPE